MSKKVILNLAISIDGYIANENGEVDFIEQNTTQEGETFNNYFSNFLKGVKTLIMGRKTYEKTISFAPIKDQFPDKDIYVLTTREIEGVKTFNGNVKDLVEQIDNNIWCFGGGEVAKQFLESDLITNLELAIIPITLGKGKRLFLDQPNSIKWKLEEKEEFNDLLLLNYKRR